jgi:tetratricopeptide (TPR) repeat protein
MHAAREEYAEAEDCLARAIQFDARHVDAHERLAQCCALRGDHRRSLELLRRANALEPRNSRIAFQLSVLVQGAGGPGRSIAPAKTGTGPESLDRAAIERLGEIIADEPDFVNAFLSLPASDVDSEVFSALAVTLERALERHPEYADLHCHCGAVYRRLGQHAAAIEHTERAVRINPRFVTALILLGQLYSLTERWTDSVQRLQEAIRHGGDYPDVHYTLGRLYQKTGQMAQARGAYERALTLNRDFQPAREALVSLQAAQ